MVLESYDIFSGCKDRLSKLGVEHEGNLGVEGREAFKRTFVDGVPLLPLRVLRMVKVILNILLFSDYLRNHPEAVKAYGELKMKLAEQFRTDITGYVR